MKLGSKEEARKHFESSKTLVDMCADDARMHSIIAKTIDRQESLRNRNTRIPGSGG